MKYKMIGENLEHRIIFENFYNIKIPNGYVIHHINGNKLCNEIC